MTNVRRVKTPLVGISGMQNKHKPVKRTANAFDIGFQNKSPLTDFGGSFAGSSAFPHSASFHNMTERDGFEVYKNDREGSIDPFKTNSPGRAI